MTLFSVFINCSCIKCCGQNEMVEGFYFIIGLIWHYVNGKSIKIRNINLCINISFIIAVTLASSFVTRRTGITGN